VVKNSWSLWDIRSRDAPVCTAFDDAIKTIIDLRVGSGGVIGRMVRLLISSYE